MEQSRGDEDGLKEKGKSFVQQSRDDEPGLEKVAAVAEGKPKQAEETNDASVEQVQSVAAPLVQSILKTATGNHS